MRDVVEQGVYLESPTQRRAVFGAYPCQGVYHRPEGSHPTTALIATHYGIDFGHHYLAEHMARRGYGFLGWNTRYRGASGFTLEHAVIDIGVGVRWLREEAGVETVVILGNSGGASLMGAYQSQANDPHLAPGTAPAEELADLPAADLYVALAAHTGRPEVLTEWLDPSVTDESDPLSVDPELDMYNPENGPPYSAEFVARYRAAQVERNHRISQWAERELERVGEGWPGEVREGSRARFDRFFSIPRMYADLRFLDLSLDPSDREVGCYSGDARQANYSGYGLTPSTSAREWLSMWSLSHAHTNSREHLPRVHQPALVISATRDQGCFPSNAQDLYDQLGSTDKHITTAVGDHFFTRPADARPALADLIASWLADHGAVPS